MKPIVVVKLGSNALVDNAGHLDLVFLDSVFGQIAELVRRGQQPVLVSSGAVACGLRLIGLGKRPNNVPDKQALAAIGQAQLMHHWQVAAAGHGLVVAQVLLTADDFGERERYLNLSAAFRSLFEFDAIPIINENDPVAVAELTVGDNDQLSAVVAGQLRASRLILLTDIDGVYDRDPRQHADARRFDELRRITHRELELAGDAGALGRGGMRSKLLAARLAAHAGVHTTIANARERKVLIRLFDGETIGTSIPPEAAANGGSRRRWLALARRCRGQLHLDNGAVRALLEQGRSLLPVGITAVSGQFKRGDTVAMLAPDGREIARGLVRLTAGECEHCRGKRLDVAARELGYPLPKTAVHRDELMLVHSE